MKNNTLTTKLVFTALMTAITCLLTMAIRFPSPTGGYLNAGDISVLTCAFLLGPLWGTLAAGLGSALADILSGYFQYAPATFVIKALVALTAFGVMFLFRKMQNKSLLRILTNSLGFALGEALMVGLYFAYEATVLSYGMGALAGVTGNCMQGLAGVIGGLLMVEILRKTKIKEKYLSK